MLKMRINKHDLPVNGRNLFVRMLIGFVSFGAIILFEQNNVYDLAATRSRLNFSLCSLLFALEERSCTNNMFLAVLFIIVPNAQLDF